jgi:hypothetical protein
VCTPDQQQPRLFTVATDLFPHPYKAMITSVRHAALQQKHMLAAKRYKHISTIVPGAL